VTSNVLVGATMGFTTGQQWTGGFSGDANSSTLQTGLYGSYNDGATYLDGIVGYSHTDNQMRRAIAIPLLPLRLANGENGANQFFGQLETGYRFMLGGPAAAFITPFARLQGSTVTQDGFTETGASSLNLTVASQTTQSLRTVFGAHLGGGIDAGWRDMLRLKLKLGWSHEYADTARPVTATLAGAPAVPFTVNGAAPSRDGVVLGLSATTAIADATSLYLRYNGEIVGQDSAHSLTAGVRMTW
jgi:outer membrane autotransporter protein